MSAILLRVSSVYTTPDGLLGLLRTTATVFSLVLASSSSRLIWKFSVSAGTTLTLPPSQVKNTLYSGKYGATQRNSYSGEVVSALATETSAGAQPHVMKISLACALVVNLSLRLAAIASLVDSNPGAIEYP